MPNKRIWLSPPHMGGEEINFVDEAFDTNWIAPVGPHVDAFEKELAAYNNVEHCAVLASGTAAIHLALIVLGVKSGDEVICSTLTFSASCNPIVYVGANPIFVDSETSTWNMDPVLLEHAISDRIKKTGKKPKAIIVVHLYGMPAKLDEIVSVARRHGIPMIEDAAEAIGSVFRGKKLGSFGDLGVYSFNGNKIITTSGGGALVSNNENWIKESKFLATQARDEAIHYEHSQIGYNYRLSNVSAGIGRGQLRVLDEWINRRRRNFQTYRHGLSDVPGITFLPEPEGCFSNRWLTTVTIEGTDNQSNSNEKVRLALEINNIESRPLWKPMHLQPVFRGAPAYVNGVSQRLFEVGLCLPSGSNLEPEDLDRIITVIRKETV